MLILHIRTCETCVKTSDNPRQKKKGNREQENNNSKLENESLILVLVSSFDLFINIKRKENIVFSLRDTNLSFL